jgi:acetoin utilization protein AcuB
LTAAEPGEVFMKRGEKTLKVRDRMSSEFYTVGPDDSLRAVIELLRRRDIRSVPVVENGKLVGIVTDRDIRQVAPPYMLFRDEDEIHRYMENLKVTAAMTADPVRVAPDTPLIEAAKVLETYKISSLPVVRGQELVGMLSLTDLLRAFIEQNEAAVT